MCALDVGITLGGHAAPYGIGDSPAPREANPLAGRILEFHPLAFVAAGVVWATAISGLVLALPRRWAMTVSVAVAQAHAFGAGTWVLALLPYPLPLLTALFLTSAVLTIVAWERSGWDDKRAGTLT
jgi:hypothetical protein